MDLSILSDVDGFNVVGMDKYKRFLKVIPILSFINLEAYQRGEGGLKEIF